MKLTYAILCSLFCSLTWAQQSFSTFPVLLDKGDYDDREVVFIKSAEEDGAGLFLSDHNTMNFLLLEKDGSLISQSKENMPVNYGSLKRAGVGTLAGDYFCYLMQGNKKITAFKADAKNKTLAYITFPYTASAKETLLFMASGDGYVYIVTSGGDAKNELIVHKYDKLTVPKTYRVKTNEADVCKSLGINTNKASEQIAVLPINETVHFNQASAATKCYHNEDQLIITADIEGETKILSLSDEGESTLKSIKGALAGEKKSTLRSLLYKNQLWQLNINAQELIVQGTDLNSNQPVYDSKQDNTFNPDFIVESSYSYRSGYNRDRKNTNKAELLKSFQRADISGLGLMETSNEKLMLVAGIVNRNNLSDPNLENSDATQKGTLDVNMIMERNYQDLHLPSYSTDQNALLRFKKEIWIYTYWTLDPQSGRLSKSGPEDMPALEESLELFYRDPQNHVAPAVWKQGETYLFGYYNSRNFNYNLFKVSNKTATNFNRR